MIRSFHVTYFMRTNFQIKDVCSIIVTFQTRLKEFNKILESHKKNFKRIIIVNNSRDIDLSIYKSSKVCLINCPSNLGLSKALNIGIKEAKKQGFKMTALFDQDTKLSEKFNKKMLKCINDHRNSKSVAVFSPVFHNHVIGEKGKHINFKPFRLIRENAGSSGYDYPHYVITSGSFIAMDALDDIGMMCEELFIDFIDIEWCLRARRKGYLIVAINSVLIDHYLGDYAVKVMGNNYPIHSPLRMYYYFRNAMYLYRSTDVDLNWRIVDASRNLFRFIFYIIFINNRQTYARYILKGYYHGFIKKMGKFDEKGRG